MTTNNINNNVNSNNNNNKRNQNNLINHDNNCNQLESPYSYLYNPNTKCYDTFNFKDYEIIQRIPIYKHNVNNRTLGNCKEFLDLVKQTLQTEDSSKYLTFYKIIVKPISLLKMFVKISKLFEHYPVLLKSFNTFLPLSFINWIIQLKLNKSYNELYFSIYGDQVVPDVSHCDSFNYCGYFKNNIKKQ